MKKISQYENPKKKNVNDFSVTMDIVSTFSQDHILVEHLQKLDTTEQQKLGSMFIAALNDEIVSGLAICNPGLFGSYLRATRQPLQANLRLN